MPGAGGKHISLELVLIEDTALSLDIMAITPMQGTMREDFRPGGRIFTPVHRIPPIIPI